MDIELSEPKIAIVHDWLTNFAGAERVVAALAEAFPTAQIYTSVYNASNMPQFENNEVKYSFLQHWPLAKQKHQLYPQLRQLAFESFDFSDFDLVISSSSAEAKGVITPTETKHISYIHTPTRYYWSHYQEYINAPGFGPLNPFVKRYLPRVVKGLKRWDYAAAQRPDLLIANSKTVVDRIKKYYNRPSIVVNPPVDVDRFGKYSTQQTGDYFLVVSRLVPYKKVDLVVEAFNINGQKLIVAGNGTEYEKLKRLAKSNIEFQLDLDDEQIAKLMGCAKGFIFPTEEDFGITPVEAMAAGLGIIAYHKGGASETVLDGETGLFFEEQTVNSLNEAIKKFETAQFEKQFIIQHAQQFSKNNFITNIQAVAGRTLKQKL